MKINFITSGIIMKKYVSALVALLMVVGVIASALINVYVLISVLLGLFFDIIAYTELTKRSSQINLYLGSIAGAMPALGGWAAGSGTLGVGGVLLSLIVFVWQPLHVSFIAYYFLDDYKRASIPMPPTTMGLSSFVRLSAASLISLAGLVWIYYLAEGYGLVTAIIITLMVMRSLLKLSVFRHNPERSMAKAILKLASPLIAVAFMFLPLEHALSGLIVKALNG
jgi:protoheme IX farnesyltransferase